MASRAASQNINRMPQDTCPLCRARALRARALRARTGPAGEVSMACQSCGSQFVLDPATRRGRYVYVSPDYASIAGELTSRTLSRAEMFALRDAAKFAPHPHPRPAGQPALSAFWAILFGAVLLAVMVCACSAALLLGPSMAQTRRQIAGAASLAGTPAAESAGATVTATATATETAVAPDVTAVATPPQEVPIDGLQSPIAQPTPDALAATATPDQPSPLIVPTRQPPTAPPPPDVSTDTPALPPTFTPLPPTSPPQLAPTQAPEVAPSTTPGATETPTVVPSATPPVTATASSPTATVAPGAPTVTPTATSLPTGMVVTGSIVISRVNYLGEDPNNPATEYVELVNASSETVIMNNWVLLATHNSRMFTFGNGFPMSPGQMCRVYANWSIPYGSCGTLSFGSALPLFKPEGDIADLRDANGVLISRYVYGTP